MLPMTRSPCRTVIVSAPVALLLLGLCACGGQSAGEIRGQMELSCQTKRCECVEDGLIPFGLTQKEEPEWRLNGVPHCRQGFHLEAVGS